MAETRGRRRKKKQQSEYFFDYSLLFIVLFLLGFGLIMIYSASSYEAYDSHGDAAYYMKRQLIATYGLQPAACGSSEIVYDPVPGKSGMQDGKKRPYHERLLYHDGGTPADRSIGVPHYG